MTRHVLLAHGYGDITGGRANFARLEPALKRAGFTTHRVEFSRAGAVSMETNVMDLSNRLMEIQAETGVKKIDVVGHSLGGLTAVAYAKLFPFPASQSLSRVVVIGAPLRGTKAANKAKLYAPLLYYGTKTIRQMSYESEYVMALRKLQFPEGPEFHVIASRHDSHLIVPWDSALFCLGATKYLVAPWDKEVIIDDEKIHIIKAHAGHVSMVAKKPVIEAIIKILKARHLHAA